MERNAEETLNCPKCSSEMEQVTYRSIEIDRCQACGGLWFDNLEHEQLKQLDGSERIDIGDPEVGKSYNTVDRISCPVCHTRTVRMVDAKQRHIRYESCPACSGVFFDAGEFTDYKKEDWLDAIRDLFAGPRVY